MSDHWSSCAVHNPPAFGPCDCGGFVSPDPVVSETEVEAGAMAMCAHVNATELKWHHIKNSTKEAYRNKARACLTAALKVRTGK